MKNRKSLIDWTPEVYDRLSKTYDLFSRLLFPIGDLGRSRVVQDMEIGSILDVACGTGSLLDKAYQRGMRCFGIDTSRGMLEQARRKVPSAKLTIASFYALPYAEGQFDYVVETNAVSGVGIEFDKVLEEMVRVCKPGGEIRIGDYANVDRETPWIRLMKRIGIWIGDCPQDYRGWFLSHRFAPQIEVLGWWGMYQFLRVRKQARTSSFDETEMDVRR